MAPMMRSSARTRAALRLLVAGAMLVGFFAVAPGAGAAPSRATAQSACDDAYGCDTTTTAPPTQPTCTLDKTSAAPGATITATIQGTEAGAAISIAFDGTVVKTGNSDNSGNATLQFTVPANASPGKHTVVFFGTGFSCDPTSGSGFQVLAKAKARGALSRTGIDVALYLAIAAVFLLVGSQLVFLARRRRRRAASRRRA